MVKKVIGGEVRFLHQIGRVRNSLEEEDKWVVFHDNDQDGLVASTLLGTIVEGMFSVWDRTEQKVFRRPTIYVDVRPSFDILHFYTENEIPLVVVDHHNPREPARPYIRPLPHLHPYFAKKLPVEPYKYNAGLLSWFLGEKDPHWEEWALLSHIFDKAVDVHSGVWVRGWLESYGEEKINEAIMLLGVPRFTGNYDHVRKLLIECRTIDCILEDEKLRKDQESIEKELWRCMENVKEEDGVLIVECGKVLSSSYISVVASKISAENPTRAVVSFGIFGKKAVFELRWQYTKTDLGWIAREVALLHDGSGGGHPPAAGLWVPKKHVEGALKDLLSFLKYFAK